MKIPARPRGRCVISWSRQHLPAEEVEALDRLLFEMRHLSNYEVADLLTDDWGVLIDYQVVQRHRVRRCITCNREAEHESVRARGETD